MTYRITAAVNSQAGWDASDAGDYTISLNANQVTDQAGNPVASGSLGAFTVSFAPTISITRS